jgi:hypothetical protein
MAEYKATSEQWAKCEADAKNWSGSYECILELRARIEQLETLKQDKLDRLIAQDRNDAAALAGSLVERVAFAITGDSDEPIKWKLEARAAIFEVAAWLRDYYGGPTSSSTALEQEAE